MIGKATPVSLSATAWPSAGSEARRAPPTYRWRLPAEEETWWS
jgi:hypothetical protein